MVELKREIAVPNLAFGFGRRKRVKLYTGARDALHVAEALDACRDRLGELRRREGRVGQLPLHGLLAADALGERDEDVGEVVPHPALVDQPRESSRTSASCPARE